MTSLLDLQRTITAATRTLDRSRPEPSTYFKQLTLSEDQKKLQALLPRCGWAKRFVDITASLGSMCDWEVHRKGVNQPVFGDAMLQKIRPVHGTQQDMRRRSLTLQRSLGVHAAAPVDYCGEVRWLIAHPDAVAKSRERPETHFVIKETRDARPGDEGYWELPGHHLRRMIERHHEWAGQGYTPLLDVLCEMEMFCDLQDNIKSAADQHKMISGLLHLKEPEMDPKNLGYQPDSISDVRTAAAEAIRAYSETARQSYDNGGVNRALPQPFLWKGDIEHIKFGDPVNKEHIEALNDLIRLASISLPIPTIFLMGDTANHWNEAETRRHLHTETIRPAVMSNDRFWTEYALRPLIAATTTFDPDEFDLVSDFSCIEVKPDNAGQLLELYKCGVVSRATVAKAANVDPLDIEDMSELDHLYSMIGKETTDPDARPETPQQNLVASALSCF